MRGKLIVLAALLMSACGPKVTLPDPTVRYPTPPPVLMEPAEQLQTIPTSR